MALGKWETRIVIPSGGWTIAVTDSAGPVNISFTAGNTYYWSDAGNDTVDFAARLQQMLTDDATLTGTYTVTISNSESSRTGKLTIASTVAFSATWTSTDFRNLCGFTGNISSTTSATGSNAVEALWLPDCPVDRDVGLTGNGLPMRIGEATVGDDGTYFATVSTSTISRSTMTYAWLTKAKALTSGESTTNESWETYWDDALGGEPWAAYAGYRLKWYADADVDGTNINCNLTSVNETGLQRAMADNDVYWRLAVPVTKT